MQIVREGKVMDCPVVPEVDVLPLLKLLLCNALVIVGVWTLFSKEMLFGAVGDWAYKHLWEWIYKPTIGCPPCMSSVWGTLLFWLVHEFTLNNAAIWPFYVLALCGIMKLITIAVLNKE